MADINSIMLQTMELQPRVRRLLHNSTYDQCGDLSGLEINYADSEQLLLLDELRAVMEELADVEDTIRYLGLPVEETAQIWKNASGRYETASGHYYCCGNPIEALISDDRYDVPYWVRTSVEHDGRDYYLAGFRNVRMDGLTVRFRKSV